MNPLPKNDGIRRVRLEEVSDLNYPIIVFPFSDSTVCTLEKSSVLLCCLVLTVVLLSCPGPSGFRTASVIIALTDGELRENQFDLAEREVR